MSDKIKWPKAIDIEEKVLGAMLVDEQAPLEAIPVLKQIDMFYDLKHQKIYSAIKELYEKNEPIDLLTVSNLLKKNKHLEEVGGDYALVQLTMDIGSGAHVEYHSRILVQHWIKRRLIRKATILLSESTKETSDCFDLLEMDAKMNDDIQEITLTGANSISYSDALNQAVKRVELISNKKENEVIGVPTGYEKLDLFTGGWQNSDLIIIGARPGMGKTAFVLKTVVECGKKNIPVGFFSLEMSSQQLATRTIAINSHFHLRQLMTTGFEKPEYFQTLNVLIGQMSKFGIQMDDTASLDISNLMAKARIWKRKHDIKLLIVDYLQLVTDHSKSGNREQEISSISRNLKKLAKELNIPVIALSQLSRSVETRGGDKRPRLSDIRESGAIEQDADIVTFLYRPEYYGLEPDEDLIAMNANAEFSFAKYRAGSLETKGLYWDPNKTKYMDPAEFDKAYMDLPNIDPNNDNPF